ncbi:MAG: hypothetical protein U9O96_01980 [Candidatus Thermoplasmatota archaeon]|nr:hypothetical protein [Candidatus Thermoplasmatota archaeon]
MDRKDRIVVLVGIVILIIAIIGVLYHEKEYTEAERTVEKYAYNVDWNEKTVDLREEGYVAKGKTTNYTYSIDRSGLTQIEFKLEWSDNLARGFIIPWNWSDTMDMRISAPSSSIKFSGPSSASGSSSPLVVKAVIGDVPHSMQIDAANETEVYEILNSEHISEEGKGSWTADIDITTKPFLLDRGNDFTLCVTYTYYEPVITKVKVS